MSKPIVFLTVELLLEIHERMIRDFGGEGSLRDLGLLESAAAMPAAQFGGQFLHEDIEAMAAAYLFHICKNHAFVDGNKRTAVTAAETFLMLNDVLLTATNGQLKVLAMGIADGTATKDDAIAFFRKHVKRAKGTP
jgi:death on curing protein